MDLDTRIREHNASLPLAERQQQARELGYIDGKPLNEDDYRRCIRVHLGGDVGRSEVLRRLCPPEDVTERRLGSLTPAEFGVLFEQEWPKPT